MDLNGEALLRANHWMLQELKKRNNRGVQLFPVFKVERKHIRLDEKMLLILTNDLMKCDKPKKHKGESVTTFKKRQDQYIKSLKHWDHLTTSYSTFLKNEKPENPSKDIGLKNLKKPIQADFLDDPKYQAALINHKKGKRPTKKAFTDTSGYDDALKKYNDERGEILNSPHFIAKVENYDTFCKLKKSISGMLFPKNIICKKAKQGMEFEASISTDGVSVSFLYTRTIEKKPKGDKMKPEVAIKAEAYKGCNIVEDYDSDVSSILENEVIGGLDPGRTSLATVTVYDKDKIYIKNGKENKGKVHVWRLSKGQYHTDSGIIEHNNKKNKWFKPLQSSFSKLSSHPLNSGISEDVKNYLKVYNEISDDWWALALMRRESRAKMKAYSGKKKVLDKFFINLKKDMERLWEGKTPKIAYGSAGPSMKPTGRGELAVPTTGTFKACKRIFNGGVDIEDESYTTKVCPCGCQKLAVYIKHKTKFLPKALFYNHTRKDVPDDEVPFIDGIIEDKRIRDKKRRGGSNFLDSKEFNYNDNKKKTSYPEVRGLRFCTKCRSFLDRDKASAKTIGMLYVLRVTQNVRPSCFCKKKRQSKEASMTVDAGIIGETLDGVADMGVEAICSPSSVRGNYIRKISRSI